MTKTNTLPAADSSRNPCARDFASDEILMLETVRHSAYAMGVNAERMRCKKIVAQMFQGCGIDGNLRAAVAQIRKG